MAERIGRARVRGPLRRPGVLVAALACLWTTACTATEAAPRATAAPDGCVDAAEATRGSIEGTPVWARFCPGPERHLLPAEVPSDALSTHLDLLDGLEEREAVVTEPGWPCDELSPGRTYELQIGFADGRVTAITGHTDPECTGELVGGGGVGGPDGLGVYGLLMTAFGRQHADAFEDGPGEEPLVCPADPREPGSVSIDAASAELDTGWLLGMRSPMVMPLTAVRGIVCTWPSDGGAPTVEELTQEDAERVRIGLHAVGGGTADCVEPLEPVRTAVVEDRTGTRRAVTVSGGSCSAVIRSDPGPFGLGGGTGFPWLDR